MAIAGSGVAQRTGETLDGDALRAELGEELERAGVAGALGGGEGLLHRQREPTAERLGEQLQPRLGVELGVHDRGDQLGHAGLQLTQLGDPRAEAERVGAALAERPAQVERRTSTW